MTENDLLTSASDYRYYAQKISNSHYDRSESLKVWHKRLGIPSTALAAIVGTAIFATLSAPTQTLWIQITTGLLSLTAAVLSALHTFLNYGEASAQHKSAAVAYEEVQHRLDIFMLTYSDCSTEQRDAAIAELAEIGKCLHDISGRSPTIPDSVYDAAYPRRDKLPEQP